MAYAANQWETCCSACFCTMEQCTVRHAMPTWFNNEASSSKIATKDIVTYRPGRTRTALKRFPHKIKCSWDVLYTDSQEEKLVKKKKKHEHMHTLILSNPFEWSQHVLNRMKLLSPLMTSVLDITVQLTS